jgi:hypothetical protein
MTKRPGLEQSYLNINIYVFIFVYGRIKKNRIKPGAGGSCHLLATQEAEIRRIMI